MLKQIISGGQTGADLAGLEAAKELGIPTGGFMPKGCLTEKGKDPFLLQKFNLKEHTSSEYSPRTFANVRDSDATVIFAKDFSSAGTFTTLKALKQYNRPFLKIDVKKPCSYEFFTEWLVKNKIEVLNVAGNRESVCKGIQEFTKKFLMSALVNAKSCSD
jgi:hypothetical protein